MDPLSITASVVAVLQATSAVISVCYDYTAALKNAPWELTELSDELKSLRDVLENLAQLAKPATTPGSVAKSRLPSLKLLWDPKVDAGPLAGCLKEVKRIRGVISPPSWGGKDGSKRQAWIQSFGWPLKRKDTKESLEQIGRFKDTLELALTSDRA